MIHKFPRFVLALTAVLFIGTVATLRHMQTRALGIEQDLWILLGLELGCFLCICLCAFRETALLHNKIVRQNAALQQMVRHDDLTHCLNRRALFEILHDWERKQPQSVSVACLMIDIDHFKRVNDQYGHACGDAILKKTVEILDRQLSEIAAPLTRYGGEEFCVILEGYSSEESQCVAERLRKTIERASETGQFLIHPTATHPAGKKRHAKETGGKRPCTQYEQFSDLSLNLTISIGIARWPGMSKRTISVDQLLDEADQALYQAKHSGRNAVCAIEIETNNRQPML